MNLSAVLGVKGNEVGGKADFIEQDSTANQISRMHAGFCPRERAINRIRLRNPIGDKTSLHYAQIWLHGILLVFVFPEKQIRYIAVTEGEDTEKGLSDFVPFKNLFNEWLAKDTSRKVKAVLHAKFAAGERTFSIAPLGYMRPRSIISLLFILIQLG